MGSLFSNVDRSMKHDLFEGTTVKIHGHPYKFHKLLGEGGFGAVYSARTPNGREVAIKTINIRGFSSRKARGLVDSYLNEVEHLNRLRQESRHVVLIHDFDFDPETGTAFIIMEKGQENLMTLIDRLQMLNPGDSPGIDTVMIKEFWRQAVAIIQTLHSHSIVHMDLKPDNLILFGSTLKIADLGISRKADVIGTGGMGTPHFSAPEIMEDTPGAKRYYGPQADIWSLGAILYYMVYGEPPEYHNFAAEPPKGMRHHPDPALRDMLKHTLVRDPRRRLNIRQVLSHPYTNS